MYSTKDWFIPASHPASASSSSPRQSSFSSASMTSSPLLALNVPKKVWSLERFGVSWGLLHHVIFLRHGLFFSATKINSRQQRTQKQHKRQGYFDSRRLVKPWKPTLDILLRSNGFGWPHQLFFTQRLQTNSVCKSSHGPIFWICKKHSQKYTQNLNNWPFRESNASAPRFQLSIQCVFFSVARSLSVFAVSVENWHSRWTSNPRLSVTILSPISCVGFEICLLPECNQLENHENVDPMVSSLG